MLNKSKTKELIVKFTKKGDPLELAEIERVTEVKILGVIFDDKLTFKSHINFVKQRITTRIYLLLRLKRLGYSKIELSYLYQSLVTTVMTYCCSVWGGAANYLLDELDGCQKKAVRFGFIDNFKPIRQHIKESDQRIFDEMINIGTAIHYICLF